uniref:Oberon coiled-coil region domain-containing protein n=1 Tax=Brassica oleracea var. oleracea TaxID=109376 RepID=A0A0D2ZUV2_BRAOL
MDLKTSKMILPDKHMQTMVSDFSLSKLAVDSAFHVSGILSMAQLDIWSPSVGVEAISNEHFRVDYTSNMHQTVIENRGLRCASDSTSGCLQAATIQPSIFARKYRLMARTGKPSNLGNSWLWMNPLRSCDTTSKCFSTASVTISGEKKAQSTWLSGVYTWLSRLHNRELEDKAKEVPELKTERHKKKLNIYEVEGIARLNLAEAAML